MNRTAASFSRDCYGFTIKSPWRLPFASPKSAAGLPEIEFLEGTAEYFSKITGQVVSSEISEAGVFHGLLANGDAHLRWDGLFEVVVLADGSRIVCQRPRRSSVEAFHTYLLGQILSFALINRGIEPLHATVLVIDGQAVALVGHSGQGKSTLAAAFLQHGIPLLTDDLLVLRNQAGFWLASPGLPRIKLFPEIAEAYLPGAKSGTRMNRYTRKLIVPLRAAQFVERPVPLAAFYVLGSPRQRYAGLPWRIRRLDQKKAFLALTTHTFNTRVVAPARLKRQFSLATQLASELPVRSVNYARDLEFVPAIRDAILSDLGRGIAAPL